ncbi:hypothetical protein AJ80_09489 [Polytolypa hystricis UAMH7299]|uniref:Uncharacterized protein n=1 Tax=Polytolypa hystricis (strain UAMH7299) TaxID=1447883 RepID=A0A2B7WPV6_POLH7|nr:hypothetical protein AJ80_09489 [Polytolypa hystricis UAMH7299]
MRSLLAIRHDIDFYKQNIWGETALAVAVKENHIGIVTQLLEVGVDPFSDDYHLMLPPAMGHAIFNRNLSMVQLLCDVKDCMVKCKNALEIAVLQADDGKDIRLQVIRTLLDAGFDPSAMHTEESTPLHTAAHLRLPKVLDIFLDKASNINVQDRVGRTILHLVVQYLPEKIERVIEAGIDTCIRDQWGKTALDLARNQSPYVMHLLTT